MVDKDEQFKKNLVDHFNRQTIKHFNEFGVNNYGSKTMDPYLRSPYTYVENQLLTALNGKIILDFCCGTGIYSIFPALNGAIVEGIDISHKSIDIAKMRSKYYEVEDKCNFNVMDAEQLTFKDNYFDIILVYGSLSYLNLELSYKELARVLKPQGKLIVIDSLGHNPIFKFNRRKNIKNYAPNDIDKLRTIQKNDIKMAKKYFKNISIKFFNLLSVFGYVLSQKLGIKISVGILSNIDKYLLKLPNVKWLAFKVVFVCYLKE